MNSGEYSCIIDESKLIEQMLAAHNKQDFLSNVFEIAQLNWQIDFYPNGNKPSNLGSFMVYLKLLSIPKTWENIIVCRRINCAEFESSATAIVSYTKKKSNGWDDGALLLKELKDIEPNKLTFNIYIRILKIISVDHEIIYQDDQIGANLSSQSLLKPQRFEWKINGNLMNKMQTSYPSKCFESEIFQNQWCLRLYPNGKDYKNRGDFRVAIQLCGLSPDIGKMIVKWKIFCDEIDGIQSEWTNDFEYNHSGKHWGKNRFSFQDFQQYEEITIGVEINILKVFDVVDIKKIDNDQFLYGNNVNSSSILNASNPNKSSSAMLSTDDEKKEYGVDLEQKVDILSKTVDDMKNTINTLTAKLNEFMNTGNKYGADIMEEDEIKNDDDKRTDLVVMARNDALKHENERKVGIWLDEVVGLSEYFQIFIQNGFDDLNAIAVITMDDLNAIGIQKIGHQRKILTNAAQLEIETDTESQVVSN